MQQQPGQMHHQHHQHQQHHQAQPTSEHHKKEMHDLCNHYHMYFIQVQLTDGSMVEGIIEDVSDDEVTMLMPHEEAAEMSGNMTGQMRENDPTYNFGGYGYGYGGFQPHAHVGFPGYGTPPGYGAAPGFGPGYGYGVPRRFRRFRRRRFPFYGIRSLFFPFFF